MNELPKDWKCVKLNEVVVELKPGYPTGMHNSIGEGFLHFRPYNIDAKGNVDLSVRKYVPLKSDNYFLKDGDVIFNNTNSLELLGKTCYIFKPENWVYSNHMTRIRVNETILAKYCATYLHFLFYKGYYRENCSNHVNQASISSSFLSKFLEIPLPPKPTQQAIVSKIEELFSELDKGIENLRLAQQQLKTYRQAVLKGAFEGRLTNENVKEGELPEGWEVVTLNSLCNKIQDGSHFSPQVQYEEPGLNRFKYITAKNIRNDYMDFRKVTYVDKEFHNSIYGRCNPEFGDVLLTKDGVNTGEVTLNTLHEPFSLLSSVCIFKTKKQQLLSTYLKYYIQSPFGGKAILDSMTGTAIKRIVLRKIKDSKIALPQIGEQKNIVLEIESRLSVADKTEESIIQSLQQAEALRHSILKKAFEGKLIC